MYLHNNLCKFSNLLCAFSTVEDGNMSFKFGSRERVIGRREKFLQRIGVDINVCVAMWVIHEDKVVEADDNLKGVSMINYKKAARVDGLITDKKGLYLFLVVADCIPVVLYDSVNKACALVHAGWKNTDLNVSGKAVESIRKKFKSKSKDLVCFLGPSIKKDSYLVENPQQKDDPKWRPFLEKINDDVYAVDVMGFNKYQLVQMGVKEENIIESEVDTAKDERFFSHYRDSKTSRGDVGRFACVVGIKNEF